MNEGVNANQGWYLVNDGSLMMVALVEATVWVKSYMHAIHESRKAKYPYHKGKEREIVDVE